MTETRSRKPFANRDFRLLWIGEAVSSIGDQFAFIALLLPTVRNLGLVPTYEATLGETSGPRKASESDPPAAAGASPASA